MNKANRGNYTVILVTCGSVAEARRIARSVVERRLAACVNIVRSHVESIYHWKGKVEHAREFLLVIKTSRRRMPALSAEVKRLHSYDVPEFIALSVVDGSSAYLRWIGESVADKAPKSLRARRPGP